MTAPPRQRRQSAGVLLYRFAVEPADSSRVPEVLLGHMGGPLWRRRDVGAWSIPKGGYSDDEDPFAAALREFEEEVGKPVPAEHFVDLGEVQQAGGKYVRAWAAEGDLDPATAISNTFQVEWPPGSGRLQAFPEFDRVAWFSPADAMTRIVTAQTAFVQRLLEALRVT
ncbi:MAG TPA: NUDIX domain-containing protein [Kineosporiaceae bacterium]|nr:NUDIX domain-containing protein [Kineosporiaceae bacterium]